MHVRYSRRRFLQHACQTVISVAGLHTAATADDTAEPVPIVDTHQHLWDLDQFRLPWLKDVPQLAKSFLVADYQKQIEGLGVVKSVYMEVDVDPRQLSDEARYVLKLCRQGQGTLCGAVIGGRPAANNFRQYIDQFKNEPLVKGVRQVLHTPATPPGYCREKAFVAGIRHLGERRLSFDLCMRPGELNDARRLAEECPDTQFILDHCGNVSAKTQDLSTWKRDLESLARRGNVACKVSGQIDKAPQGWTAETLAPIVHHVQAVFGPQRVVFGGDWPVCNLGGTLGQWITAMRQIVADQPRAVQQALLHDNALRVYRLDS